MTKKLANFESASLEKQVEMLEDLTLNNLIKYFLISRYPGFVSDLGSSNSKTILNAAYTAMGINENLTTADSRFPFYRPVSEELVENSFEDNPLLHEAILNQVQMKYKDGGRALAYFDNVLNDSFNKSKPTYYIAVSTKQDLLKVLGTLQKELFGKKLALPVANNKQIRDNNGLLETNLVDGSANHYFYKWIRGDADATKTPLPNVFSENTIDAIIAVTPGAAAYGVPIRTYRRKSPESIALKFGYGIASFLIFHSYISTHKKEPGTKNWRGKKYEDHLHVGAHDIYGAALFSANYKDMMRLFSKYGLNSTFMLRNPEFIGATGEMHYDLNPKNTPLNSDKFGRIELHGWDVMPEKYIGPQIIGSRAWAPWKASRGRELEEMTPVSYEKKSASKLMDTITTFTKNTFFRGINIARYPGEYHMTHDSGASIADVNFQSLRESHGEKLEGRYTLYNLFPY